MNTKFIETFIWLAKLGNFSKIAEKLNATQPAISSRINSLEDLLGVELYIRGSRPIELTAEGKKMLGYAEKIYQLEEQMREVSSKKKFQTSLKIGVIETVTLTWLTAFIRDLNTRHKDAVLEITTDVQTELLKQLLNDDIDLVFGIGPVSDPNTENVPLCKYGMYWIGNPEYFNIEDKIDILDLVKLPIILTKQNSSFYPLLRDTLMSYGLDYVFSNNQKIKVDCVYSFATGIHLLKEGIGVMAMPPAAIFEDLNSPKLKIINVREKTPDLHLTAFYKVNVSNQFIPEVVSIAKNQADIFCEKMPDEYATTL